MTKLTVQELASKNADQQNSYLGFVAETQSSIYRLRSMGIGSSKFSDNCRGILYEMTSNAEHVPVL
eukprot:3077510-Amphidinium_carterae.1